MYPCCVNLFTLKILNKAAWKFARDLFLNKIFSLALYSLGKMFIKYIRKGKKRNQCEQHLNTLYFTGIAYHARDNSVAYIRY